jgi:hypothetical protein
VLEKPIPFRASLAVGFAAVLERIPVVEEPLELLFHVSLALFQRLLLGDELRAKLPAFLGSTIAGPVRLERLLQAKNFLKEIGWRRRADLFDRSCFQVEQISRSMR